MHYKQTIKIRYISLGFRIEFSIVFIWILFSNCIELSFILQLYIEHLFLFI